MSRIASVVAIVAMSIVPFTSQSQSAAKRAASPAVDDTSTVLFEAGGVRIIHRRAANDVVAANLYLLGGTRQLTERTAGIETLLLAASERGTRRYPRAVLDRKLARLGTVIVLEPGDDWTVLGVRATPSTFDSTWAILADRIVAPRLDTADVELVRTQLLNGVRQRRDSPDAQLEFLADSAAFTGHPYALSPVGTEQSLSGLRIDDLRRYRDSTMVTSRMLLVVVGNVDRASLGRLVQRTLGVLPRGNYRWTLPDPPAARAPSVVVVDQRLPTNYIQGVFVGPTPASKDYQALRLGLAILGGRLNSEIRVRRGLTYAVDAPFVERALASGGLYITTVAPDTSLAIMRREIASLQEGLIEREGLDLLVQHFITRYFLENETNADQANFLARAQLYRGDWRVALRFADEMHAITPEDIRAAARNWIHRVSFAYLGDPSRAPREMMASFQ